MNPYAAPRTRLPFRDESLLLMTIGMFLGELTPFAIDYFCPGVHAAIYYAAWGKNGAPAPLPF